METTKDIRRAVVDAQAYRACQYLEALKTEIEHKKSELGYPGVLSYDRECEENASGMIETAMDSLACDPPIPIRSCIVECDSEGAFTQEDVDNLVVIIGSDCERMFGNRKNWHDR